VAVTIIRNFEQAVSLRAVAVTIGELANGPGLSYRHPDSAQVSYPRAVQTALGRSPGAGMTRVAIRRRAGRHCRAVRTAKARRFRPEPRI
jgi:hypothetical protein